MKSQPSYLRSGEQKTPHWSGNILQLCNHILHWSVNWIKPRNKGRDMNNVSNYYKIMIDSLMMMVFGCVVETKFIRNVENGKRWYGQVGFLEDHTIVGPLVILKC